MLPEKRAFVVENARLSGVPKRAVALVPSGDVEAARDGEQLVQFCRGRGVAQRGRGSDEEDRFLGRAHPERQTASEGPVGMAGEPARNGLGQRHLEIEARRVTGQCRKAESFGGGCDVVALEFDRTAASPKCRLERPIVFCLVVGSTGEIVAQYREIARDGRVVFRI